jgi:sugar O-acyltransferase (sialic acid O-acetyltransferase NeuD family)
MANKNAEIAERLMQRSLMIWGAGDHAKALLDEMMLGVLDGWKAVAVVYPDDTKPKHEAYFRELGLDVIPQQDAIKTGVTNVAFGIGDNAVRQVCYKQLAADGYQFPSIISKNAYVSPTARYFPHAGVQIFSGALLGPTARVEGGCIINHLAIVEHDAGVGAFSHLAPRATLLGGAKLGANCMMGSGATLLPYLDVVDNCIIGAGSMVNRSIEKEGTYVGIPAQLIVHQGQPS